MTAEDKQIEKACEAIATDVMEAVKEAVKDASLKSFQASLDKIITEGEFYKTMNTEIRTGLKGLYKYINQTPINGDPDKTSQLFHETSKRLEEVMDTTKSATDKIMTHVEKMFEERDETEKIIKSLDLSADNKNDLKRLQEILDNQNAALTEIMTACSFEDLTGQRLLKVIEAMGSIKDTVFDLYLSSGLMIKDRKEHPGKDTVTIMKDSRKRAQQIKDSELKGPSSDVSQDDVDDLLKDLGL